MLMPIGLCNNRNIRQENLSRTIFTQQTYVLYDSDYFVARFDFVSYAKLWFHLCITTSCICLAFLSYHIFYFFDQQHSLITMVLSWIPNWVDLFFKNRNNSFVTIVNSVKMQLKLSFRFKFFVFKNATWNKWLWCVEKSKASDLSM